jgi:two-component system chemotaxis response regulator CheB
MAGQSTKEVQMRTTIGKVAAGVSALAAFALGGAALAGAAGNSPSTPTTTGTTTQDTRPARQPRQELSSDVTAKVKAARHPVDGEQSKPGTVYVAPTDRHLTIASGGVLRLTRGPRENGHRPAIDPLFRTAAEAYGARLAAVVLTGTLDDGTAGLVAVADHGGTAIVQDPTTALHPSMPLSALTATGTPHVHDIAGIAELLRHLVYDHAGGDLVSAHPSRDPGGDSAGETVSIFTCPECGGTLFEQDDASTVRFRCRVGHAYAPETLAAQQSQALEAALWAGARALLEKADLAERLERRMRDTNRLRSAGQFHEQAVEARRMSDVVTRLIEELDTTVPEPEEDAVQAAAGG